MPLTPNIAAYYDVQVILDSARSAGGLIYTVKDAKQAIRWRSRAYYYRSLLRKADFAAHKMVPGYIPTTAWDDLFMTLDDNKVIIKFGTIEGQMTDLDGNPIRPAPVVVPNRAEPVTFDDPDYLAAMALVQEKANE